MGSLSGGLDRRAAELDPPGEGPDPLAESGGAAAPLGARPLARRRYLVSAAAGAGHDVLRARHVDALAEDRPKRLELLRAESGARGRRRADGAVILDEQKSAVGLSLHLGHVSLLGSNGREHLQAF